MLRLLQLGIVLLLLNSCQQGRENPTKSRVSVKRSGYAIDKLTNLEEGGVLICAHRGMHQDYPENSLPAIQSAVEAGVDIVEIDIRTTADSVLVLMHDATIDRTTSDTGLIHQKRWEDLKKRSLLHQDSVTKFVIPTLEQVFKWTKGKPLILDLDIKAVDNQQLVSLIQAHDLFDQIIIYHSDSLVIRELFELAPQLITMPICKTQEVIAYYLKTIDPVVLHYHEASYTPLLLGMAKEHKVKVFINALGGIDGALNEGNIKPLTVLVNEQPDIIQTDYPEQLLEFFKSKQKH